MKRGSLLEPCTDKEIQESPSPLPISRQLSLCLHYTSWSSQAVWIMKIRQNKSVLWDLVCFGKRFFTATDEQSRLSVALLGCVVLSTESLWYDLTLSLVFLLLKELNLPVLHFPDLHNGADYNCQPHRIVVRIN